MEQGNETKTIVVDNRTYEINSFTGKVADATKGSSTRVFGGGGGGGYYQGTGGTAPVQISSVTTIHDQFFLINKDGHERAFQLNNFNVAVREGHIITVMSGIQKGQSSSTYFAVYNHNTSQLVFNQAGIEYIISDVKLGCLVVIIGLWAYVVAFDLAILAIYIIFVLSGLEKKLALLPLIILSIPPILTYFYLKSRRDRIKNFKAAIKIPDVQLW